MEPGEHAECNLLRDPLLTVRTRRERVIWTLPEVLAGLVRGEVVGFEALRPHQEQAWFAFVCQLGGLAAARELLGPCTHDPGPWRDALTALGGDLVQAWDLVGAEPELPAFMQPPVHGALPVGAMADRLAPVGYQPSAATPGELDVLVTARNHDIKPATMQHARAEHWLYALVSLQTCDGFAGRGNYGIARMNGGFGSRVCVSFSRGCDWGARFRQELEVLPRVRARWLARGGAGDPQGHALLWCLAWRPGPKAELDVRQCDPLCVEVCRRLRLVASSAGITSFRATSLSPRMRLVEGPLGGLLDPWAPCDASGRPMSLGPAGFRAAALVQALWDDADAGAPAVGAALQAARDAGVFHLRAVGLARGQGRTHGLHARELRIPADVLVPRPDGSVTEALGTRAREMLAIAQNLRREALAPALGAVMHAAWGVRATTSDERLMRAMEPFDVAVERVFFERLFGASALSTGEARERWQTEVVDLARSALEGAWRHWPIASYRRHRAWLAGHRRLDAGCAELRPEGDEGLLTMPESAGAWT